MNADLYVKLLFEKQSNAKLLFPITPEMNIVISKYKDKLRWVLDISLFGILSDKGMEQIRYYALESEMSDGVEIIEISQGRIVLSFAPDMEKGAEWTYKLYLELLARLLSETENYEDIIDMTSYIK